MNSSYDGIIPGGGEVSDPWIFANLYLFYLPVCVFLGLSGNAMVWILIKTNRMLSRLPTNTYLLCLALMSSMFLVFLLVFWLEEVSYRYFNMFHVFAFKNYNLSCKVNTFLAHVCDFSSVWLIVLVCCERLVLLYRKRRSLTKERARLQVIVLILVAMFFNSWILLVASLNDSNQECDIDLRFLELYNVMTILETIVCMMVPTIFIVISNILVRYKLNYHLKNLPGSPGVSFNTADVVVTTASSAAPSQPNTTSNGGRCSLYKVSSRASEDVVQPMIKPRGKKGIRPSDIQLTRSLLVVFILLNLPNYLYRIANTFNLWSRDGSYLQEISWLVHVLLYTHHALLFYLYIFYSPQMKRRLLPTALKLLECYCFKPPGDLSSDS